MLARSIGHSFSPGMDSHPGAFCSVGLAWFGSRETLSIRIAVNNAVEDTGVSLFILCGETELTRPADLSPPFPQVFASVFHNPQPFILRRRIRFDNSLNSPYHHNQIRSFYSIFLE